MTVARAVLVVCVALSGLSLAGVALVFTVGAAVSLHTVRSAAQRARLRETSLGPLAGAFPARRMAELDEAMERVSLAAGDEAAVSTLGRS